MQDIEGFAGTTLGPGTLYGALSRLEGMGLIAALEGDGRRRPYRLTPDRRRRAGGEAVGPAPRGRRGTATPLDRAVTG